MPKGVRFYKVRYNIGYSLISIKLENFHLSLVTTNRLEDGQRKKFKKSIFFPLNYGIKLIIVSDTESNCSEYISIEMN